MNKITIKGTEYTIINKLNPQISWWGKDDFKNKVTYFETIQAGSIGTKFLANYGKYWGVGDNYYDSIESLYLAMFQEHKEFFLKLIEAENEKV